MATGYSNKLAQSATGVVTAPTQAARWESGKTLTVTGQYNLTSSGLTSATNTTNSTYTIQMVPIPAGATVVDWVLSTTDVDTHTTATITLNIGDGTDLTRFASALTTGQSGGNAVASSGVTITTSSGTINKGLGFKYTSEDTIDITVAAGPATSATSGAILLTVTYYCGEATI